MATKAERLQAETNIHKAMSHPLRHRILRILNERVASPIQISHELGLEVNEVAYHVRKLQKLGCIEMVGTRQVRGATEHSYRAIHRSMVSTEDWEALPSMSKDMACDEFMQAIVDDFAVSRRAGVAAQDKHFHISRTPITVDEEGRDRILELLEDVRLAMEEEHAASLVRLSESGGEPLRMSFGIATFPMPSEEGARPGN